MAKDEIKQPETVTMTKEQFDSIMGEFERLKRPSTIKPKRVTERNALLRFYDGKPVVGYANVREKLEDGKKVAYIDLSLLDVEKPVTVKYIEFLNENNGVKVLIKNQTAKQSVAVQGVVRAENPDPAKISTKASWNSPEAELEVVSVKYSVEVEVLEGDNAGKTYVVDSACLNA